MDEKTAIYRLKHGDIEGLEALVAQYQEEALRVAYLITGNGQAAEDVVQDSFLNVYRSIRHFDESRSFKPWFMRAVVNAAIKAASSHQKEVHEDGEKGLSIFETQLSTESSPEEEMVTSEFKEKVRSAVSRLSPRQRAAVVQRYYLEMSEKEMAAEMGAAPGTVKWLISTARSQLRVLLDQKGEAHEK